MDSEGDESSHLPSKRSKPTNYSRLPSTKVQEPCPTVPTLPPELIANILSRLPVKSLLKFRSVSKSWLALISSPQFINTHLSLSVNHKDNTHHRLLMLNYSLPVEFKDCSLSSVLYGSVIETFDLDYSFENIEVPHIVGSVNGLVCFAIGRQLFIWSPSTRKSKKIPNLAKPGYGSYVHAFGYDELHDAYKIVRFFFKCKGGISYDAKVDIYSLKTDSWSTFDDFPCGLLIFDSFRFVNGNLHWVTNGSFHEYTSGDIVSIDLAIEKWGKVEQPCYGEGKFSRRLEVLRNNLSVFCIYEGTYADVWVMKEYGVKESWTKTYTIKFPNNLKHNGLSPSFCMSNKGEIVLVFGSTVIIYNPRDDSVRDLEVAGPQCLPVEIYIESLVCPTLQNEPLVQQ